MDNNYLNLSPGEAIYDSSRITERTWEEYSARYPKQPCEAVTVTKQSVATMPLRKAGRKKLDEHGKTVSGIKAAMAVQRRLKAMEERRVAKAENTQRKKAIAAAHRQRQVDAAIMREKDIARANRAATTPAPPAPDQQANYEITHVSADGTRNVRVAANTILEVPPGKDINEVVARYNNRKRIIF